MNHNIEFSEQHCFINSCWKLVVWYWKETSQFRAEISFFWLNYVFLSLKDVCCTNCWRLESSLCVVTGKILSQSWLMFSYLKPWLVWCQHWSLITLHWWWDNVWWSWWLSLSESEESVLWAAAADSDWETERERPRSVISQQHCSSWHTSYSHHHTPHHNHPSIIIYIFIHIQINRS